MREVLILTLVFLVGCSSVERERGEPGDENLYSLEDYDRVEKIDAHIHIFDRTPVYAELARRDRFRFVNITVDSGDPARLERQLEALFYQLEEHPDRIVAASAFSMEGWDEPGWAEKTIEHLDRTFERGAVGVKVWKNIGMVFRDREGELVMIDDPGFDPVFRHLLERDIRLIGHLGEPLNCWLPLEEMSVHNDRSYFERNPQYHMYLHPEMPSHDDQMAARDRMLARHSGLKFQGAHLASLEHSVDELARFLDRFPQAVVDTAARMGQVQAQSLRDREKVRKFFLRYRDRILYATDHGVRPGASAEAAYRRSHEKWRLDWKYLVTDQMVEVPELDEPVRGLALPRDVVDRIYRLNAERFWGSAWQPSS